MVLSSKKLPFLIRGFLLRTLWCFWYAFVSVAGVGWLSAHDEPSSELSSMCRDHVCACTVKGFCDDNCCCAGQTLSVVDSCVLQPCGSKGHVTTFPVFPDPHYFPVMKVHIRGLFGNNPFSRPSDMLWIGFIPAPPEKVPIYFS